VVQRHRARRVHYDLRFEIDGVLVSWAVPNGPTLDPAVRRLAVHVEDHPIEYLYFEGVIPRGQYGAGDVIVWDTGTWEPHGTDDPAAAVAAGDFHADVTGHKLRGRLVLVRRGGNGAGSGQWLLLHKADDDAVSGWDPEDYPKSVLSGRTNEQVRADPDRVWLSDLPPAEASVELHPPPVAGPADEELAALDELGAGGRWEVFGRELRLTNLDKELFPGRAAGHQARADFLHGPDRPGGPAIPGGPPAEHAPLPRRRGRARVLAQATARPCAGVGPALAQPGGHGRREQDLPGGRRGGGAGVGRQLRRAGVARLDRARQRPGQPQLRPDRYRPR
jgi:DNA ligase D-like protein (predicted 3'-phosphoesterase)